MRTWYARLEDLNDLVIMARKFHAMSPFSGEVFSAAGTRQYLKYVIEHERGVVIRTRFGAIGGMIEDMPFCMTKAARELFWFTDGTGDGILLLKKYEEWAKEKGARIQMMSAIRNDSVEVEKVNRVLGRFGYECIEYGHIKVN